MFVQLFANYENKRFPVIISNNCIKNILLYLKNFNKDQIIIITDKIFKKKNYHPCTEFSSLLKKYNVFFFDGGIKKKNFKTTLKILEVLNKKKLSKNGLIVSIGGGVISDICGFVSSIYKRGVKIIHVPTTMTSAVDSSIGGKTGINHLNQVNFLGTYYHPEAIFIDIRFLNTLKKRDFLSGLVETIKKAIISDEIFFKYLKENSKNIKNKKGEFLIKVISDSIKQKIYYTSNDVRENSTRLLLNYGHTFGQALESYYKIDEKKLTHGEAVSLGMICAAKLSFNIFKKKELLKKHYEILKIYELPTKVRDLKNLKKPNLKKLCSFLINDKKRKTSVNRFIVCKNIGEAKVLEISSKKIIENSFKEILTNDY